MWACRYSRVLASALIPMVCLGMNAGSCTVNSGLPGGNNGGSQVNPITILSDDHVLGDANAPVVVVEYSDFQCPFCGRFARQEFAQFKQDFIDTGKVRFVFRHFPLTTIHSRAEPTARASECANDQVDFFAYHDEVFADQSDLSDSALHNLATGLGADGTIFDSCVSANAKSERVKRDMNSGAALGINATPTFYVNGQQVVGFQTAEQLGDIVNSKLAGG